MAKGNKLYSAYRGAGKAAASYKASLYDIENIGIEREGSQAMHQFETEQRDKNLALLQEGIGLASDIYGGYKAKKDAEAARGTVQESMAKKAYKPGEGGKSWDELDPEVKKTKMAEFKPIEVERDWVGKLFGDERKYTFGKGGDEYTSAQITASSSLLKTDALEKLTGSSTVDKVKNIITKDDDSTTSESTNNVVDDNTTDKDAKMEKVSEVVEDSEGGESTSKFGDAFKKAKKEGKEKFEWMDEWYHTRTKEEEEEGVKSFAKGGEYTTDGPEMILVGDNPGGKEKVKVTPIKSEGKQSLADNIGTNLKDLVSKKGSRPGSKKWMNEYIGSQKINNESLRPLQGELSKHNDKLFSMAEESGYFGEFFKGGWE